jgi:hypothetical protein
MGGVDMTTKLKAGNFNATYSADQVLKTSAAGALSWGAGGGGFDDVFSTVATSVTYAVPADITKLLVFITGGGGGGGDGGAVQGWGAVAGTTVIARVTVVALDTITIAVGAGGTVSGSYEYDGNIGGDSTFTHASGSGSGSMSTITAPGGKPGRYNAAIVAPAAGTVGANNEGISILGGYGNAEGLPNGGASFWGGGGQGARPGLQQATAGTSYGSGGGGGSSTASYKSSAAGANGICFIMEFK